MKYIKPMGRMGDVMEGILSAVAYFVSTSIVVLAAVLIFDLLTRYKVWEEISKGNMAVSFAAGGISLGVANVMRYAISANDSIFATIVWGGIGTVALLLVYFAFELLTPKLNVTEEIGKGNQAVGFISFIFSLAFSFIIGASIS